MAGSYSEGERIEPGIPEGGPTATRTYVLSTRSKLAALLAGVAVVGLIAMLLAVGFTVLVALAAIGTLTGLTAVARRAVLARMDRALGRQADRVALDPSKRVFPAPAAPRLEDR